MYFTSKTDWLIITTSTTKLVGLMENLIASENFEVKFVKNYRVSQDAYGYTQLSGYAIFDMRNKKMVSLGDEFFTAFKTKRSALAAIKDGLFDNFTHFEFTQPKGF